VFPSHGAEGHLVELKKSWAAICRAADLQGLRLHDLRHSFASVLASAGLSLPIIGALLGHSSPTTTNRYSHLMDGTLRAAAERVGAVYSAAETRRPPAPVIDISPAISDRRATRK
jgi:integrase